MVSVNGECICICERHLFWNVREQKKTILRGFAGGALNNILQILLVFLGYGTKSLSSSSLWHRSDKSGVSFFFHYWDLTIRQFEFAQGASKCCISTKEATVFQLI